MNQSISRHHVAMVITVTLIYVVADLVMLPQSHVVFSYSNAVYLLKAAIIVAAFFLVARTLAALWPKLPRRMQGFVAGTVEAVDSIGVLIALFVPLSMASLLFMYLAASTTRPLMDAYLASFDKALGFDWLRAVEFANKFPSAATIMVCAYAALSFQVPMVPFFHAVRRRRERMLEFMALIALSGLLTGFLMLTMPVAGAYSFHMPNGGGLSHFTTVGFSHLPTLALLRTSAPFTFLITNTIGITTFPSFHTALGIIITYNLRHTVLFLSAVAVNSVMIVATIPEGGHYFADVLAGIAVALVSIAAVRAVSVRPVAEIRQPAVSS
ncbi:phosphatase PAP2 family protein [Mesorhizobium sp. B2-6-2]|uniref:phosphatase PAP2 family protein n=1 Tax=Mesorhizobium sp. B2-6-2 TaxID=2589915 RepID=UPI00112903AE|nr:phosphatase PAP2 family protein [Mesorhizobium sp. B2-6-2]TPJ72406.1 phosphatase PAP2 family protein [Mesorhizobium sp. B2-6-2]